MELNHILWVGTDQGLDLVDLKTYKVVQTFKHSSKSTNLSDNSITGIYATTNGKIWVLTSNGAVHIYQGNGSFKRIYNKTEPSQNFGVRLHFAEDQSYVWIKSENKGIFKLNKNSGDVLSRYPSSPNHYGGIHNHAQFGIVSMEDNGVKSFNKQTNSFTPILKEVGSDTYSLLSDSFQNTWIVANESRRLFCLTEGRLEEKTSELFNLSDNVLIRQVSLLNKSALWISTNNGLYQLAIKQKLFSTILRKEEMADPAYVSSFRGMLQDADSNIFMGGYGGLFRYSKDKTIQRVVPFQTQYSPYQLLHKDKNFLWVISEGFGLLEIDKKTGRVNKPFSFLNSSAKHKFLYLHAGLLDQDSSLWLGGYEGIFRYNPKTHTVDQPNLELDKIAIQNLHLRSFYVSKDNYLWLSTTEGLFVLNKKRRPIVRFHEKGIANRKLPSNNVTGVLEDSDGAIWIFTNGGGICKFIEKTNRLETFDKGNGLADNHVVSGLEDNLHQLWLGTNNGLSKLDLTNNQIQNFYEDDGLSSNEFNVGSAFKSEDGRLFFGGINGINIFNPTSFNQASQDIHQLRVAKLVIENDNNEVREVFDQSEIMNGLNTSYKNRNLNIEFFTTDFLRVENNSFKYKLEGLADNWISLGNAHNLRFASLPVGEYTIVIKGIGSRGVELYNEIRIPVMVSQVFYKTTWFILAVIIVVGFVIYRIQQIKIQKLNEIAQIRTSLASDLHDDVGSVLTRIAMQAELIESDSNPAIKPILKGMIHSCQSALSSMRDVVWSIDSRDRTIGNVLDKIGDLSQQLFEGTEVNCMLRFEREAWGVLLNQQQKQELYFIVKEALHNALKHSVGNEVEVTAKLISNKTFMISVHNKGNGNTLKSKTGLGLKNMKMRADRITAQLEINGENGFTVRLCVPIAG